MLKQQLTILLVLFFFISHSKAQELNIETSPHTASTCSGQFVEHSLDHFTLVNEPIGMFESNGSGLAINDLNNDGLLDIVLANMDGEESILWNEGNLSFRRTELDMPGKTRSVAIFDLDADGWNDIILTSQRGAPSMWRNLGDETFDFEGFVGVSQPAYSMNWADLDHDGDLDLVAASYDAEMERIDGSYLLDGGAGVYYYENLGGQFDATRLADRSQALAIYFPDINNDGNWDIAIGNDFAEPDAYWQRNGNAWLPILPFGTMTHSTMSFAGGDVNNDGSSEIYATDMHPYADDEETMAAWQPVMDGMVAMPEDDPQAMENVLQTFEDGTFTNVSANLGINFTGWSWSAKFGDLNSDGFLDLYVVNGMIDAIHFAHLPNNELVEENQVFMNQTGQSYSVMPDWGLNATQSGRGMSMADLDNDGDLDIVVNNLMSATTLYENQLCEGNNLTVSLADHTISNTQSIGSQLLLHTSTGTYRRDIYASSGYLSGDPSQVHFGIPDDSELLNLEIFWTDGTTSTIENLEVNQHLLVSRNS